MRIVADAAGSAAQRSSSNAAGSGIGLIKVPNRDLEKASLIPGKCVLRTPERANLPISRVDSSYREAAKRQAPVR